MISVIELSHGIYRAKSSIDRQQRQGFVEELCLAVPIQPVTLEIAQLAGKLVGEQAAKGITFPIADLLIGATALHLALWSRNSQRSSLPSNSRIDRDSALNVVRIVVRQIDQVMFQFSHAPAHGQIQLDAAFVSESCFGQHAG